MKKTYRMYVFCDALKRYRSYPVRARSKDAAWTIALRKFFTQFPIALKRGLVIDGGWHYELPG